jgi:hypothetical protein
MALAEPQQYPILLCTPKMLFPRGFLQIKSDNTPLYERWVGKPVTPTWGELCDFLGHSYEGHPQWYPDPNHAKQEKGAWGMGRYTDNHKINDNWLGSCLMVFDIDRCHSREQVVNAFIGVRRIIHTSYKHRPEKRRYRVVIPLLTECCDRVAFRRVHAAIITKLVHDGHFGEGDIDSAGKDAARAWFMPMHQPDVVPEFGALEGEALDWHKLYEALPPEPVRVPSEHHGGSALGAIKKVIREMEGVPKGERHPALCKWCGWLKLIGLTADDVMPMLLPAVTLDPHDEANNERTIRGLMGSAPNRVPRPHAPNYDKNVEDI